MAIAKDMRKLLVMNVFGHVIFIYIGLFVNLYIWEEGKRIFDVSFFNLFMFLTWGAAFALGAQLLTRFTIRLVYALSACSGMAVFVFLPLFRPDNRLLGIAVVGVCVGVTFGLFYAAQNLGLSISGKAKQYGEYFATVNVLQQVASVTVPIASALVIEWLGYTGSFVLMFLIVGGMLAVSCFVPKITLSGAVSKEEAWYRKIGYGSVFGTPSEKWLHGAFVAAGLFFQFQNLFVLLFTFHVTEDKLMIALLNTCYTLSSFAALYLYKKIKWSEDVWMLIGSTLSAVGFLVALARFAPLLVLSNLLATVGMFYFSSQWLTKVFRSVNAMPPVQKLRVLVWREWTLCASRCVMLLFIIRLEDIGGPLFVVLVALTIVSMYGVPFCFRQSARRVGSNVAPSAGAH